MYKVYDYLLPPKMDKREKSRKNKAKDRKKVKLY